jgi:hypothetical protein
LSLSREAPPLPPHPAGEEGTEAHSVLETFIKRAKFPFTTKQFLLKNHNVEMVQHGLETLNKVTALRDKFDPAAPILSETRLDTSEFTAPGNFGTCDILIPAEKAKTLIVLDYKYGVVPVDVKDNWQITGYALAASIKFKHAFKYVLQGVIQPRGRTSGPKFRSHAITLKELLAWKPKFLKAVERTKVKNPVVKIGGHCYFCPAREFNCPAYMEKTRDRLRDAFGDTADDDWLTGFLTRRK